MYHTSLKFEYVLRYLDDASACPSPKLRDIVRPGRALLVFFPTIFLLRRVSALNLCVNGSAETRTHSSTHPPTHRPTMVSAIC